MTTTLSDAIDAFTARFGFPVDRSATDAVWEWAGGTIALRDYPDALMVEASLNRCTFTENLANTTLTAAMETAARWCEGAE